MAGRSSGATVRRFFIRAGILPFLLRYSCQKVASVSLEETWPRLSSACFASSSIIACMDVLSFSFVLFSGQQKSSVPLPRPPERPGKRDEAHKIHSSAVPPGFRPALSQAARRSKRRNGAHRPALLSFRPAARERTSACARAEALSAGEASLFAAVRLPTLSVAAFGVFRSWSF